MNFEHEAHETTFNRVSEDLPEFFENPYHDEANGHFYVRYGSTVLEISVDPYGPNEAVVRIMSYCVQGAEIEPRLLNMLLEINHSLPLGSFSVVGDDIFFAHSLFGRDLEPRDLLGAIAAVANLADEYDDRLVARFGGQTALERIQDTGGLARRRGSGRAEAAS
jgi:hypothetical protein